MRSCDLALDPNRQTDWLDHSNGEKTLYQSQGFDDGPSANTEKVLDILLTSTGVCPGFKPPTFRFGTGHEPKYRP